MFKKLLAKTLLRFGRAGASLSNDPEALYKHGLMQDGAEQYTSSAQSYEKATRLGHVRAQFQLAWMLAKWPSMY